MAETVKEPGTEGQDPTLTEPAAPGPANTAVGEAAPKPALDPHDVKQRNPQAHMKPIEKNTLEKEHIAALGGDGEYALEEAWHRHFINSNGQMADVNDGEKKIKAKDMLERVKRALRAGKIQRAIGSPAH